MKYCGSCGAGNKNSAMICNVCGEKLEGVSRKGGSGAVVKILAAVLSVSMVAGGVALLVNAFGQNALSKSFEKTSEGFSEAVQEQPNLQATITKAQDIQDEGAYTTSLSIQSPSGILWLETDFSRSDKQLSGTLGYTEYSSDVDMKLNYSADKNSMEFCIPQQLANVYGFRYRDFEKKYSESLLPSVLPVGLPENLKFDFFTKKSRTESLQSYLGESYDLFVDSIEVNDLDERPFMVGGVMETCHLYQVVWSSKALGDMVSDLAGVGFLSGLSGTLLDLIPEIEPDCRFYVSEEGALVGVDFVAAGNQYVLVLEGRDDPWEVMTLTKTSLYQETEVYTGGLKVQGSHVRLLMEGDAGVLVDFAYEDTTGDYNLNVPSLGLRLEGYVKTESQEMEFCLHLYQEGGETVDLLWTRKPLQRQPKRIAKTFTDLFDMSINDWERLLLEVKGLAAY